MKEPNFIRRGILFIILGFVLCIVNCLAAIIGEHKIISIFASMLSGLIIYTGFKIYKNGKKTSRIKNTLKNWPHQN